MRQPVFNSCAGLRSVVGGTPRANQNLWRWRQKGITRKSSLNAIKFCPALLLAASPCWPAHREYTSSSQLLCKQGQQQALGAQWAGNVAWNHQLMHKQENHCMRCSNAQASRQRLTALSVVSGKEPVGSLKIRQNPFSNSLTHSKHQKRPFT